LTVGDPSNVIDKDLVGNDCDAIKGSPVQARAIFLPPVVFEYHCRVSNLAYRHDGTEVVNFLNTNRVLDPEAIGERP
jgi:hypothetical protein